MSILRVQSSLHTSSGLPEDRIVTTWFCSTDITGSTFGDIRTAWLNFQDDVVGIYPGTVEQNGHDIKIYDMADVEPRAPIYEGTWDFGTAPAGDPMPSEVALCLSYQAERLSGVNQASRRGRMFLGPLDVDQNDDGRPQAATVSLLVASFVTFVGDLATDLISFGVYSRVLSEFHAAVQCWSDDAFDTQRRRGVAPTSRVTSAL